jgi:hypothetical protein
VLAGHAREIESIIHIKFQNSVDTMPKGTRHITLLYHQVCAVPISFPKALSNLPSEHSLMPTFFFGSA